jgi:hypothetical protein
MPQPGESAEGTMGEFEIDELITSPMNPQRPANSVDVARGIEGR